MTITPPSGLGPVAADAGQVISSGPAQVASARSSRERRQGSYAGIVSRTVSLVADAAVLAVISISSLFLVQAVLAMVDGVPFGDIAIDSDWGLVIVASLSATYFTVGWAVFGRTVGEALLGLRLIRRNGRSVGWIRAYLRFAVSPLAFVACGLGYVWILFDRRRRTWPDLLMGTVVIYDWRRADDAGFEERLIDESF